MKKYKHLLIAVACIILTVCIMSVDIFIIKGFNNLKKQITLSYTAKAQSSNDFTESENPDPDSFTATAFINSMSVGWNLGNSLDSHYGDPTGDANLSQETIWGNPKVSEELIDYVNSLGFNTIRIPVSWYYHSYRDSSGHLFVNDQWLQRVKEVVDYCYANDMYVILNSHHDGDLFHTGVSEEEFQLVSDNLTDLWTQLAIYFNDYDDHLIFEAYNEVDNYEKYWSFGSKAAKQLNELNQLFVDTVRSTGGNNARRILMIPTLLDNSGKEFLSAFSLPNDTISDRLLVTVHYYPEYYDETIEERLSSLESFSKYIGAPVVIGEWGTKSNYEPISFRSTHASNYVARCSSHGIKCIYWDNGSDYAIINRKNLSCNQEMISAIMNPQSYTTGG